MEVFVNNQKITLTCVIDDEDIAVQYLAEDPAITYMQGAYHLSLDLYSFYVKFFDLKRKNYCLELKIPTVHAFRKLQKYQYASPLLFLRREEQYHALLQESLRQWQGLEQQLRQAERVASIHSEYDASTCQTLYRSKEGKFWIYYAGGAESIAAKMISSKTQFQSGAFIQPMHPCMVKVWFNIHLGQKALREYRCKALFADFSFTSPELTVWEKYKRAYQSHGDIMEGKEGEIYTIDRSVQATIELLSQHHDSCAIREAIEEMDPLAVCEDPRTFSDTVLQCAKYKMKGRKCCRQ